MTSPDTLGLLLQRFLGSYADGHRTMGGTGHTTRNQKFMQAGDAHQTEGARDAPPRGTCKQRRSLQIQRCHNPTGSDEAQGSQKKPLLSHSTQRGARAAPSEQERRVTARRPGATHTPTRTRTRRHQHRRTQMHKVSDATGPAREETGAPGRSRGRGTPAPPKGMSAAAHEPDSAGEFLERLASLLLIRLPVRVRGALKACDPQVGLRSREPARGRLSALPLSLSTHAHTRTHAHTDAHTRAHTRISPASEGLEETRVGALHGGK